MTTASITTIPVIRKRKKPTIANIEKAIDILLTLYIAGTERHERQDELSAMGPQRVSDIPIGAEADMQDLCEDPRRACYRKGIHELGQHLHDEFARLDGVAPLEGMSESLYRIAGMDSKNEDSRGSALDHIWDGVGDGKIVWMS